MGDATTIRALAMEGFGRPPSVIDVPAPEPTAGEVLVRVRAASVNAYDTFVAAGMMKDYLPYGFPAVLGQENSRQPPRQCADAPAAAHAGTGIVGRECSSSVSLGWWRGHRMAPPVGIRTHTARRRSGRCRA